MTEPAPPPEPVDLLVTPAELEPWVQADVGSLATDVFTLKVLWGTSVLIRDHGLATWTHANLPERAKLIAIMVAKNYYEHPTGEISETTGPLSSRYIDAVVHSMELMPEQIEVLERLAGAEADTPGDQGDLQVLRTTRGPVETRRARCRTTVYVKDSFGSTIGYYDPIDSYAYTPLSEVGG